jgi:uncharacterized protein (DUF433 family)
MSLATETIHVPLEQSDGGPIRIAGSRVTLDTVVEAFEQGETPETIVDHYPGIALEDVYAVIAYYLRHKEEVGIYLEGRRQRAEEVRRDVLSRNSQEGLREQLLARRAAKQE